MKELHFSTSKKNELLDITQQVQAAIPKNFNGACLVYTPHATAAIAINENYDPNICTDVLNFLEKLIPENQWLHDKVDGNAASHIKSAIIGPSETIPIKDGKLLLGSWQSIMFCEFDGPRQKRKVILSILQ